MRRKWLLLILCTVVIICFLVAGESFSTDQGSEVPDTVVLDSLVNLYEAVIFDHALHDSYASCAECHHHVAGRNTADPACSSCHRVAARDSVVDCKSCHLTDRFSEDSLAARRDKAHYHIDIAGLLGAYHINCLGCHLSLTAGPTGCLDCHRRNEAASSFPPAAAGNSRETE